MAEELIKNWDDSDFDFSHYKDRYQERVGVFLDAKKKGDEVVVPEEDEEPQIINLMDALERSLSEAGGHRRKVRRKKSRRKTARKRA
jgi:DNA end-binding protein Ku